MFVQYFAFGLLVVPDEKSENEQVIWIHLLGTMNLSTKFNGNLSDIC